MRSVAWRHGDDRTILLRRGQLKKTVVLETNHLFKIGLIGLLVAAMYYSTLSWLATVDWAREDYSYGYLIPLIVLYLLWDKRSSLFDVPNHPSWSGLVPFLIGLILFWLGELGGEFFTLYASFWLVLVGLCWLSLGWEKLKAVWFAFFMLLTMFPLPNILYGKVSFQLKLVSSKLGVWLIQLYGMSAYREGNVIDLGFTQLQVVDACSGLRYLIPLIVLGILLAYFFHAAFWKRIALVLSTIPLSIITNSLRIALTGILYESYGAQVAEGFFHGFSGWFIFMTTLAVLVAEMWLLKKMPPREVVRSSQAHGRSGSASGDNSPSVPADADSPPDDSSGEAVEAVRKAGAAAWLKPPQFVAAVALIGLTLILSQGVEFREKIPISQPLDQFPLEIGPYTGQRQTMEERFIVTLDLSDYTIIDYKDPDGRTVNFYVAYYESQRKGESIHSPATCLPGGGWQFKESGAVDLPMKGPDGQAFTVNRAFIEKGEYRQISYYWFPQRGRILTNAYQLKMFAFWDALTKQRTDGALVRIITPVYPNEAPSAAEQRLQAFTADVTPVLAEFLPGR